MTAYVNLRPTVVLMDLNMPGMDGIDATESISAKDPEARVLIVSAYADISNVAWAMIKGASGFLSKSPDAEELLSALRAVSDGRTYLQPPFASQVMAHLPAGLRENPRALTSRQKQVLRLICQGLTTKQIGRRLGISTKTIQTHRQRLMERMQVHDVAGLFRRAMEMGLLHLTELNKSTAEISDVRMDLK